MDTAGASLTSFVTEPIRFGSGFGESQVEWEQGNRVTAVALGVGDVGRDWV